jgi:excisionase family DNA binding protein
MRDPALDRPKITVREAATRANVSIVTIYRWARAGKIRGYLIGDAVIRVDEEDVNDLIRPLTSNPA